MNPDSQVHPIASRHDLIRALQFAAELEQMLCCEYLYAGFSVRKTLADFADPGDENLRRLTLDRARPWLNNVYLIARQEMEHLGIVTNLLSAVGAEPCLEHRRFPVPAGAALVGAPLCLGRFDEAALQRFIWYERPAYLIPPFPTESPGPPPATPPVAAEHPAMSLGIGSIQELYTAIATAFQKLSPGEIFRGNTDRQMDGPSAYSVEMVTVTNREEAAAAVGKILEQGEGIGENPEAETSHFQRFVAVLDSFKESQRDIPGFDPALPAAPNPALSPHPAQLPITIIDAPETVPVMRLFNECYGLMLVMMKTLFARYSASLTPPPRPQAAVNYATFFPMMTMVIRPLGEILTRLPAGASAPGLTAGPSFEIGEPITINTDLNWYLDRLTRLSDAAASLREVVADRFRGEIEGVFQSLTSVRLHMGKLGH